MVPLLPMFCHVLVSCSTTQHWFHAFDVVVIIVSCVVFFLPCLTQVQLALLWLNSRH